MISVLCFYAIHYIYYGTARGLHSPDPYRLRLSYQTHITLKLFSYQIQFHEILFHSAKKKRMKLLLLVHLPEYIISK